jgi:hypothetical protein
MQYLLLIYADEKINANMTKGDFQSMYDEYGKFTESIIDGGQFMGGDALEAVATATSVKVRDGKTVTTDGPFAETKEQLGGYYLVDAKDLDEAIGIAARIPTAKTGCIEVRPIKTYEES